MSNRKYKPDVYVDLSLDMEDYHRIIGDADQLFGVFHSRYKFIEKLRKQDLGIRQKLPRVLQLK